MGCKGGKKGGGKKPAIISLIVIAGIFLGCASIRFEGYFKMKDGQKITFDSAKIKLEGRVAIIKTKNGEQKVELSNVEAIEMVKEK